MRGRTGLGRAVVALVSFRNDFRVIRARQQEIRPARERGRMVTVVLPLDGAAGASEGTERLPVRRMLPLFEVVVDRW